MLYAATRDANRATAGRCALLGIVSSAAALTRPLFAYLAPLYTLFILVRPDCALASRARQAALVLIPACILMLSWCTFNYVTLGYFGLTTNIGCNLSNHAGGFIEYAPDRYGVIRDIYLKHRQIRLATKGSYRNTIYYAYNDIVAATGFSQAELCRHLTSMSISLFARHPVLYARSCGKAWLYFWDPVDCNLFLKVSRRSVLDFRIFRTLPPDAKRKGLLHIFLEFLPLVILHLLFLLIVLWEVVAWISKNRIASPGADVAATTVVFVCSILQAMADLGENHRYGIPVGPLVLYVVLTCIGQRYLIGKARKKAKPTA
jgi:hypothetical protein